MKKKELFNEIQKKKAILFLPKLKESIKKKFKIHKMILLHHLKILTIKQKKQILKQWRN